MELPAIGAGLSALRLITEAGKAAIDIAKKIEQQELLQKIVDLQAKGIEVAQQNLQLSQRISELEESLKFQGLLKWDELASAYFVENASRQFDWYCPKCWGAEKKAIRIRVDYEGPHHPGNVTYWSCFECKRDNYCGTQTTMVGSVRDQL